VFEIGTTLREARVRRKLTLQQVEEDTKIRVKYLQAMENEDFDVMPGSTYVKGFLRTYATYLGLDARIVLDEYGSRLGPRDEHEPFGGSSALRPRVHRRRNTLLFVAVLCLLVLAVLYALGLGREQAQEAPPTRPEALGIESPSPSPEASPATTPTPSPTAAKVPPNQVRITARDGDCWLRVRRGGADGAIAFEGVVPKGTTRVWQAEVLWVRIGSPSVIGIRVGGEVQPPIERAGPVDVLIEGGELEVQR
jgi:cytoskeleton protein RodZ